MLRASFLAIATAGLVVTSAGAVRLTMTTPPVVKREVVAVYFGTEGTDARSGMVGVVRRMRVALQHQAGANGEEFVLRGVSLESTIDDGIRHLATFGVFDEISVGGNWTNSAVVTYLGGDMSNQDRAAVPQVVLLEREVRRDGGASLSVGPEHEIGRYAGAKQIEGWVSRGAPLSR